MGTAARLLDERRKEIINGRVVMMSPRPVLNHYQVARNIARIFEDYLLGKTCRVFGDGVDLYLSEDDQFIPDGMVVCDPKKIGGTKIIGAPDLVVEVLSPSTANHDRKEKKNAYAKHGVKEYWIVNIESRSVEVYLLQDGVLDLDKMYSLYPVCMIRDMSEAEKMELLVNEFYCSIFPDLPIPLEKIFSQLL